MEFTFYILQRFLDLREAVAGIVNFNKSTPQMPFAGDIEFLLKFDTLFKSIEFATTEATGERFVTSSTIIPIEKMMGNKINAVQSWGENEIKHSCPVHEDIW
ncbi:hypothetical protein NPIL_58581 [Nephila pilipes]|uniref:Uncharacterized protein n=1 Tax=Nephila pilipes TaxID=299642 RepID=A0A8X6PK84_NEPPI|nr:hypothetical protein NPIL_58581 [Nephila pilipes]